MEDLTEKGASLAFSRFVYLLSLAAGEDLRPLFKSWRFKIEHEVNSLRVYRSSCLTLSLSSESVNVGDPLVATVNLTDAEGSPISNQTVSFCLTLIGGSPRPIGNATTDRSGNTGIAFKVEVEAGSYEVVASYEGSLTYGQRKVTSSLSVEAPMTKSTMTVPVVTSTTEVTKAMSTPPAQTTWPQTDWPYLIAVIAVVAVAVVLLTRQFVGKG
jgi:hypothetical protein